MHEVAGPAVFPAAYAQQRLMLIEQFFPGSAAYQMPFAVRLRGRLRPELMVGAVHEVVRRHEALRTVFTFVDGAVGQIVEPAWQIPVEIVERPAEATGEEWVTSWLSAEAGRPFDMTGRLLRVHLLRVADDDHLLAVTMHHLVSDMWSCGIFIREVAAAYRAFAAGEQPQLPALPVQYVDYTAWQAAQFDDATAQRLQIGRAHV